MLSGNPENRDTPSIETIDHLCRNITDELAANPRKGLRQSPAVMWALATLRIRPRPCELQAIERCIERQARAMTARELCNLLWSYGTLALRPSPSVVAAIDARAAVLFDRPQPAAKSKSKSKSKNSLNGAGAGTGDGTGVGAGVEATGPIEHAARQRTRATAYDMQSVANFFYGLAMVELMAPEGKQALRPGGDGSDIDPGGEAGLRAPALLIAALAAAGSSVLEQLDPRHKTQLHLGFCAYTAGHGAGSVEAALGSGAAWLVEDCAEQFRTTNVKLGRKTRQLGKTMERSMCVGFHASALPHRPMGL